MARARRSWTDKLNDATPHEVKRMPRDFGGLKKGELVLVPSVRIVDDFIRSIPAGEHLSIAELRRALALRHGAEVTCPVYTGYHLRTVAEAACEAYRAGAKLQARAPTVGKLSAANAAFLARRRAHEGL
jgi:hypothetical protein